jgi:undecaprenyl-diphosphatase
VRRRASVVDRWDIAASAALGRTELPLHLDRVLPRLTRAADHSVLWMVISVGLGATGRRALRRAAARGLSSVAVSSLLANQVGKRLLSRRRPDLRAIPMARIAHRIPRSSSFPSGHSASAAAFAAGVAIEAPALLVPVGVLAAGVAVSRVHTGMHYPSDVVAGVALGGAIALAGARIAPPVRQLRSARSEAPVDQPPRPGGRGVVVVVNPMSGPAWRPDLVRRLPRLLPEAELVELGPDDDVESVLDEAAARAEVLGVAGGDGTINCAARAALARDIPLLVVPGGTFNHFAKDLDLQTAEDAVAALEAGRAIRVDVGEAADRLFLNTASLGSYPQFVITRERWEKRLGKPLAALLALIRVARSCPPLIAEVDGERRELMLMFVGSNDYLPHGFVPRGRARLDTGRLDVRFWDVAKPASLLRAVGSALAADLRRTERYVELHPDRLTVRGVQGTQLACDGEVHDAPEEIEFCVRKAALTVYCGRRPD